MQESAPILDSIQRSLKTCVENIYTYSDEGVRAKECDKLKTCVKKYCKMGHEDEVSDLAIKELELQNDLDLTDWKALQNQYKQKLTQFINTDATFARHPLMKEFENHISNAQRNQHSEDMELAVTETTNSYIDPISKKPIKTPMRNKICKHVYEKETIESFINQNKNKGCPYMGCTNNQKMLADHLEFDKELQLSIQTTQQASQE